MNKKVSQPRITRKLSSKSLSNLSVLHKGIAIGVDVGPRLIMASGAAADQDFMTRASVRIRGRRIICLSARNKWDWEVIVVERDELIGV